MCKNSREAHIKPVVQAGTSVQVHEALGMGSSGTVMKATLTQRVAIKRANRQAHKSGEEEGTPEDAATDGLAQENVDFEARMLAMFKVLTLLCASPVPLPVVILLNLPSSKKKRHFITPLKSGKSIWGCQAI